MKTKTTQSKTGKSMLLTLYEGFSTYTITLPMTYAIRFFVEGLAASLHMLSEVENLSESFKEKDGERAHIQETLRKCMKLYDEFLEK